MQKQNMTKCFSLILRLLCCLKAFDVLLEFGGAELCVCCWPTALRLCVKGHLFVIDRLVSRPLSAEIIGLGGDRVCRVCIRPRQTNCAQKCTSVHVPMAKAAVSPPHSVLF